MSFESLITSGRIADIILAILAIEALALGIRMRASGKRSPYPMYLAGLAAGGCLVLALRAALTGSGWFYVAMFLTLGFLAHAIELGLRWFREGS